MSDIRCPICRELPLKCEHTMQEILDAEKKESVNYLANYIYLLKSTKMVDEPPKSEYVRGYLDGWLHARSQIAEKLKPHIDVLESKKITTQ